VHGREYLCAVDNSSDYYVSFDWLVYNNPESNR
jgi:hypothetical protein